VKLKLDFETPLAVVTLLVCFPIAAVLAYLVVRGLRTPSGMRILVQYIVFYIIGIGGALIYRRLRHQDGSGES
jgi:hypothetical protein